MLLQEQIDSKDGVWKEVEYPGDPNIIALEVNQEFVGRFVVTKANPSRDGDVIHTFELLDSGELKKMYGKANLDNWLSIFKSGDVLKIKRLKDKNIGQPKPLQVFKVWIKEEK